MVSFLNSKYPALRSRSAQNLYEALNAIDELEYSSDEMQQTFGILSGTTWNSIAPESEKQLNDAMMSIRKNLKALYGKDA